MVECVRWLHANISTNTTRFIQTESLFKLTKSERQPSLKDGFSKKFNSVIIYTLEFLSFMEHKRSCLKECSLFYIMKVEGDQLKKIKNIISCLYDSFTIFQIFWSLIDLCKKYIESKLFTKNRYGHRSLSLYGKRAAGQSAINISFCVPHKKKSELWRWSVQFLHH